MKTLTELCVPRDSVFEGMNREDVKDLDNLKNGSIDAKEFFEETYITEGMENLFESAFRRFAGKGANGLIRLTQNMGGGKSHAMIALGLLSQNPTLRHDVLGNKIENVTEEIRVVSYTGRNNDIQYGIWGEIASQLGKKEQFNNYYTPLEAPGQSAWIELLKGSPLLILLDELPTYMEYAQTKQIGDGTLATMTVTALSNLFNAVGKAELSNVCIVISDLKATYEVGSQLIERSFKNLDSEISRSAKNIEPVRATSDDLYMILRKRLFKILPDEVDIKEIASAYKDAVNKQRQVGATNANADTTYSGIIDTYPFHFAIKDLFARFKENNNFQQTRGFIRLSRQMVKNLYEGENPKAAHQYLINPYDIDLNDADMSSMIRDIKPKLTSAVAHDIISAGRGIAEEMSMEKKSDTILDISRLLLLASLGDVTGALQGLSEPEIIGIMAAPGKDLSDIKKLISEYKTKAWYLYVDQEGRYYYKDIKNINAEMRTVVDSYTTDIAKLEIKKLLEDMLKPTVKDCYQNVLVFPGIDEINLANDKITLIAFEPNTVGGGLHPDLDKFYASTNLKNRVMFLSGEHDTMNVLYEAAKEHKAINAIIKRLKEEEHVSETDSQYILARDIQIKTRFKLSSAIKETFVTLYYPTHKGIRNQEITMNYIENNFDAEKQIRDLLISADKFLTDTSDDEFRQKIEARIFTTQKMLWRDVQQRAAETEGWQWYKPSSLNEAKESYISMGRWIEENGMVDKQPPLPESTIAVREIFADPDTGETTLKIIPKNGDTIYYEINQDATTGSSKVDKPDEFKTDEIRLSFLCVDSTGKHPQGATYTWTKDVKIRYRFYDDNGQKKCELKADSNKVKIKYTTDGSNPKSDGADYVTPFSIPQGARKLQAIAENSVIGTCSQLLEVDINYESENKKELQIDKTKCLKLLKKISASNAVETYDLIGLYKKHNVAFKGVKLDVQEKKDFNNYIELMYGGNNVECDSDTLLTLITDFKEKLMAGVDIDIQMEVKVSIFKTGQDFEDWVAERKEEINDYFGKIQQ